MKNDLLSRVFVFAFPCFLLRSGGRGVNVGGFGVWSPPDYQCERRAEFGASRANYANNIIIISQNSKHDVIGSTLSNTRLFCMVGLSVELLLRYYPPQFYKVEKLKRVTC